MPAQPGELDDLTAKTRLAYEKAWQQVQDEIESLALDPKQARKRARLQQTERAISAIMDELDGDAESFATSAMPEAFGLGGAAGAGDASGGAAEFVWNQVSQNAVQSIANNLVQGLLTATQGVKQSTKRLIREVAKDEELRALIQGDTAVAAAKRMRQLIEANGVHAVQYADGSKHGLREYAQMAIRTQTGTAYNMGSLEGAAQQGTKFWECFDGPGCGWSYHDDPNQALGRIVGRDEAAAFPLSHPNCRRAFGPRPDITSKAQAEKINKNGGAGSVTDKQIASQEAQDEETRAAQRRRSARARAMTKKAQQEQQQSPVQASRADRIRARKQRVGREAKPTAQPALKLDADMVPTEASGVVNGIDYYKDVKSVQQLIDEGYKPEDAIKEHKRQKANAASRASKARKKLGQGQAGEAKGQSWIDQLIAEDKKLPMSANPKVIHFDETFKGPGNTGVISKAFKQDTPPGEYVYIHEHPITGSAGARIHSGIAVRRDGVTYWLETTAGEPISDLMKAELEKNVAAVQAALKTAPLEHQAMLHEVGFAKQANPEDAKWALKYSKPGFKSAATGGNGRMTFWDSRVRPSTVLHELGHTVDSQSGLSSGMWLTDVSHLPSTPSGKTWQSIIEEDAKTNKAVGTVSSKAAYSHPIKTGEVGVTDYGMTNRKEDFAEAYRLYLQDRFDGYVGFAPDGTTLRFVDLFPERAKALDKLTGFDSPTETVWRTKQRALAYDMAKQDLVDFTNPGVEEDIAKSIVEKFGLPKDMADTIVADAQDFLQKQSLAAKAGAAAPKPAAGIPKTKSDLPKNVQASIASKKSKYKKALLDQGVDPAEAQKLAEELEKNEVQKRLQGLTGVVGESATNAKSTGTWRPGIDAKANRDAASFLNKRAVRRAPGVNEITLEQLSLGPMTTDLGTVVPGMANHTLSYYNRSYTHFRPVLGPDGTTLGFVAQAKTNAKWVSFKIEGAAAPGGSPYVGSISNLYKDQKNALKKLVEAANSGGKAISNAAGQAKDDLVKAISARLNNPDDWAIFREYAAKATQGKGSFGTLKAFDEYTSEERARLIYTDVNQRIATWASTSGDSSDTAVAMQMAIKDEFKTGGDAMVRVGSGGAQHTPQRILDHYAAAGPWYRRFARAQYENTQELLAAAGVEEISVYRGMRLSGAGWWTLPGGARRGNVIPRLQPANSWSTARSISLRFAGGSYGGAGKMLEATVPRERILGCARTGFGCLNEKEYVILETELEVSLEVL